jgi:uncharacterized membrane protein YqjE
MGDTAPKPAGLPASLRRIGDSLLGLVESRLQLFALELQSEKLRLAGLLCWLSLAVALGGAALFLFTAALALYLWETSRFAGLLAMGGVLTGAAAAIFWRLRARLKKGPPPFTDTIAEFKKDRACFLKRD